MIQGIETYIVFACSSLAVFWAIFNAVIIKITKMPQVLPKDDEETALLKENTSQKIMILSEKIAKAANSFLIEELNILAPFVFVFSILIWLTLDIFGQEKARFCFYHTFSFLTGVTVSLAVSVVSLKVSISANFRTAIQAQKSLNDGFNIAYRVGCVAGFTSVGICVMVLMTNIVLYDKVMDLNHQIPHQETFKAMANAISCFGLGSAIIAFFGRVGGGLYTKASDVGADLMGKVEGDTHSELTNQIIMVADKLGDYIGNIIGMGSDLNDSMACIFCAIFVIISNDLSLCNKQQLLYPFLVFSVGIIASFLTSVFAIHFYKIEQNENVFMNLRIQMAICAVLTAIGVGVISYLYLPVSWSTPQSTHYWYSAAIVVILGVALGFTVEVLTDYFTQYARQFSRESEFTRALNLTQKNLSMIQFGYFSTMIPIAFVALALFFSMLLLGVHGLALITTGMLATLPIGLSIDSFSPVCSNAKDMSEILDFSSEEEHRLIILNSAGKRFSYTRPGFSISCAFLTSVSLYAAFVVRSVDGRFDPIINLKINNPWIFCSILIGILMPYSFSTLTTRSIARVVEQLVMEFQNQLKEIKFKPQNYEGDFEKCVEVTSRTAIYEILAPILLVTGVPLLLGIVFHPLLLYGFLPGVILSGFQLAISLSNTCGPWDNTKKMINSGTFMNLERKKMFYRKTESKPTTLIGETLGDSLKDASGSSLNLLGKLLSVVSLVFVGLFSRTSVFAGALDIKTV